MRFARDMGALGMDVVRAARTRYTRSSDITRLLDFLDALHLGVAEALLRTFRFMERGKL